MQIDVQKLDVIFVTVYLLINIPQNTFVPPIFDLPSTHHKEYLDEL
jgi:hypothetical protein